MKDGASNAATKAAAFIPATRNFVPPIANSPAATLGSLPAIGHLPRTGIT
jgi:hypothetical protein